MRSAGSKALSQRDHTKKPHFLTSLFAPLIFIPLILSDTPYIIGIYLQLCTYWCHANPSSMPGSKNAPKDHAHVWCSIAHSHSHLWLYMMRMWHRYAHHIMLIPTVYAACSQHAWFVHGDGKCLILFVCVAHVANIHFMNLLSTPPFMSHHWMHNRIWNLMVCSACSQHAWFENGKGKCHEMQIFSVDHFWNSLAAPACMWHHEMQNWICNPMVCRSLSQHAWFKNGKGKCCSLNAIFFIF